MNKKFTKLMAALALLVFMMPSLAGWGQKGNDDYSIVMKDSGGIGESTSISTVVNTSIAEGNTYVQSISSVTAVYFAATGNGWKLGSGSAAGTFTLGLSSTAQALTVSKVVVKAKNYSTDVTTLTVTLTKSDNSTVDKSFSSLGSDFTDYEFELSSATTIKSIKVNTNGSKKRAYVHNIDVITAGGSATCTVTYDCNGGETDCPSNLSDIEPGTSINLAAAPTKAHFNFNGWKTGETTYQAGASYTVNSSVTFTAQWEPDGTYFEGSICFSNQSSCTAINSTSVTGDDDLGNTWTITTAGTSSFTANSAYYQVGSGTSPASRITFTTTFDEEVNVTDFSAAFGGFNVTKATITINVNNTTVGTGSLNGGTDVTVTNTSAEHGTTLTVIVEPTAGGVKCYSISYAYETLPPPAVATPVISVDETFVGSTTAEITCATTGATIYYSYDNSTWTEYTAALTITETKTIYAKAVNGTDESAVASKTTTRTWYEPTVNIDATGITNTDVYVSTTAGSLAATVNYNSEAISGITVTWSGDNDLVATIDASTGAVTLVSVGTVNFTASFAGNDEYSSASATYQMTVTSSAPNVQPTDFDINLNNSLFGTSYTGTVSNITDANPVSGTSNNVTVTYAGAGNHYINNDQIRFYPNNKLTFDAPEGYIITKIVFTASSWGITVKVGNETINSSTKTWEGQASQVIFTGEGSSGNCQLTKATITLAATYTLTINGYTSQENGWNLIASPVATTPDQVTNMLTDETAAPYSYDLYRYNASAANGKVWENYHQHSSDFNIVPGQGYLYANSNTVELSFTGTPYVGNGVVTLPQAGYNLIGNPYSTNATIDAADFYIMNEAGSQIIAADNDHRIISPMQGLIVEAAEANETVTFTQVIPAGNAGSNNNSSVVMNLSRNRGGVIDRAIVRFGEGRTLSKFEFFENSTKLYIAQDGKDYAVARSEAQGEMPVSFHANENGQYTLTVNAEGVEMNYLHLIDNMTGADIDLLQTPSYTFNATTSDYASRFKLVFAANEEDGPSTSSGTFAFYNGSEWVISNMGEATLQVVDVMGRVVSTETVSGNATMNTNSLSAGIYMMRLINGNDVKVQKIVVR